MAEQMNMKGLMPDVMIEKRIYFLLCELSDGYGEIINFKTFFPKYSNVNELPVDLRGECERVLLRETQAIRTLANRSVGTLSTREKLLLYFVAVSRLIDKLPAEELNQPRTWADVRKMICREIESGKKPDEDYAEMKG